MATHRYVGDKKDQLRHGKGEYSYTNKFFHYSGDWENGVKHGHGQLSMADGSYYKGSFVNGEIEGHGYRVFANGSTYTGQFRRGEFQGQGLYKSFDGMSYEGEWEDNKRNGHGLLVDKDGSSYEGEFHNHKRHGEGVMTYSNGDRYEGGWVYDTKHGHGRMVYSDGSLYEGQWRANRYHGDGSLFHASGIIYEGLWIDGYPEIETTRLILEGKNPTHIHYEQGKTFDVALKCIDDSGGIITIDSGRTFSITALADFSSMKKAKSSSVAVAQLLKNSRHIATPLGKCIPYELLQAPQDLGSSQEDLPEQTGGPDMEEIEDSEHISVVPPSPIEEKPPGGGGGLQASSLTPHLLQAGSGAFSGPATKSLFFINKKTGGGSDTMTPEEQFLFSLTTPSTSKSIEGKILFKELFIPPPPPAVIPASVVDEQGGKQKHIPKTASGTNGASHPLQHQNKPPSAHDPSTFLNHAKRRSSSPEKKKGTTTGGGGGGGKKGGGGGGGTGGSKTSKLSEKEKLQQSKRDSFCPAGVYVLVVNEVTDPPFLGRHLSPFYITVQVGAQKIGKDTSLERIIKGTKSSQLITPSPSQHH